MKPYYLSNTPGRQIILQDFDLQERQSNLRGIKKKYKATVYMPFRENDMGRKLKLKIEARTQKSALAALHVFADTYVANRRERADEACDSKKTALSYSLEWLGLLPALQKPLEYIKAAPKIQKFEVVIRGETGFVRTDEMNKKPVNLDYFEIRHHLSKLDEKEDPALSIKLKYQQEIEGLTQKTEELRVAIELNQQQTGVTAESTERLLKVVAHHEYLISILDDQHSVSGELDDLEEYEEEFLRGDYTNEKDAILKENLLRGRFFTKIKEIKDELEEIEKEVQDQAIV